MDTWAIESAYTTRWFGSVGWIMFLFDLASMSVEYCAPFARVCGAVAPGIYLPGQNYTMV